MDKRHACFLVYSSVQNLYTETIRRPIPYNVDIYNGVGETSRYFNK